MTWLSPYMATLQRIADAERDAVEHEAKAKRCRWWAQHWRDLIGNMTHAEAIAADEKVRAEEAHRIAGREKAVREKAGAR